MKSIRGHSTRCRFGSSYVVWVLWLTAISIILISRIAPNLSYYPPLGSDEGMILSPAYKLATQNIFGSDLYRGFYDADQRFYILPNFHSLLLGVVFKLLTPSIETARYVSLISALILLWAVSYLSGRWYGLGAGMLTAILLSLWCSYFGDNPYGLPWISIARSVRYDGSALALFWLSLVLLDRYLEKPRTKTALLLGIFCSATSLSQFYTALILPIVAILLFWKQRSSVLRVRANAWLVLGLAIVFVPYLIYILLDPVSFIGQNTVGYAFRAGFTDPLFYLGNIANEGKRYQVIFAQATTDTSSSSVRVAALLSIVSIGVALILLIYRLRKHQNQGNMMLTVTLAVSFISLTVFEMTKAPLYTIALYPALCIALGALFRHVWYLNRARLYRIGTLFAATVLLIGIASKTQSAFASEPDNAHATSSFATLTDRVFNVLPQRSHILTSDRIAWLLRDNAPISSNNLVREFQKASGDGRTLVIPLWLRQNQIEILLFDDAAFGDVARIPALYEIFLGFLEKCTTQTDLFKDPTYGWIHTYRIFPDKFTCTD